MITRKSLSLALLALLLSGCFHLPAAEADFPVLPADKPDAEWWKELQGMGRDEVLQRFHQRVDALIGKVQADDPLLLGHFRSMKALVLAQVALTISPEDALKQESWVETFARRFLFTYTIPGDAEDAKVIAHARKQGRWFHAYASRHDNTLSYCWIFAPKGYWEKRQDKGVKYPLIVNLHGSCGVWGPVWASWHMSDNPPGRGDQTPKYDCFTLLTWGRAGYRPMSDVDLWQELDWVQATFPIDADRRCITGASLGGAGTWHFATRSPGYWAAVVPEVGTWGEELMFPWLQENIKDTPVLFVNGERDANVSHPYPVYKALKDIHANVRLILNPEIGHNCSEATRDVFTRWMLSQKRERPKEFSFVVDSPWYPGRTGILMYWDPIMSTRPRFTCRIQGQEVRIDSAGTPGMSVDLGPSGLGMQGEVTVFWNGKQVAKTAGTQVVRLGRPGPGIMGDVWTVWSWPLVNHERE